MIPINTLNRILPHTVDAEIASRSSERVRTFYQHKEILTHEERVELFHKLPWVRTGPVPYMIDNGVVFSLTDYMKPDGTVLKFNPKTMEWDEPKKK